MSKKLMLLALAAISAVMFALPAVAAAGEWEISTPEKFTATGKIATLTVDPLKEGEEVNEVECSANSATGKYTTKTTGEELTLTFTGCHLVGSAITCTTSGQASGTIKTTDLTFHNIMIEATNSPGFEKGLPGVLITPNAGHFASFVCGGFIPVEVRGNGIIGEVEKTCGETSKTTGLNFTSKATGTQTWTQITTSGTVFDLTSTSLGTTRTASEDATGTITFGNNQTITCP